MGDFLFWVYRDCKIVMLYLSKELAAEAKAYGGG